MANTKLNILEHPKQLLLLVSLILASFVILHAPRAHAAACPSPSTDMGSVTSTISVSTAGTYRAWSRIMSGTASTDNSYSLEIDGSSCFVVGDNNSMATGSWQWVNYQNGATSSPIDVSLSVGTHTIKMIGREDGVKLDRVGFTTDTACVPTGTGDNCFPGADTTGPTVSITSPAAGAKIMGTINVSATATDDSGTVSKVELYVDTCSGSPVATVNNPTSSPVTLSWNTTTATNAAHNIYVKAYDPSSNSTCSAARNVTVDNSAPTVTLTSPLNGQTVSGIITLSATASDNVGVTSVGFFNGFAPIASDTTSPYSYSWDTSSLANGTYTIRAQATDAAGNITTSAGATITISNGGAPDTQKPTTSITSPANGSTLAAGANTVNASASDNVGVTKVELYVDGSLAATDVAAPYSFSVNSTSLANGSHSMFTRAYDAAGNVGQSTTINVTVNNPSANPGDVTGDGHDTILDLSTVLSNYGQAGTKTRSQGDLNNDATVNILDLSIVLSYYGT